MRRRCEPPCCDGSLALILFRPPPPCRFGVRQGQARQPVDVSDQEGHRQSRLLPLLLPMVDSGHLQSHLPLAAGSLSAARSGIIKRDARAATVALNSSRLLLQWWRRCSTRPSRGLMGYRPPRCSGPSGSCCCWAPSTVRSSPPGPPNPPPARAGRDAGRARCR